MKLSTLVEFRNMLNRINTADMCQRAIGPITVALQQIRDNPIQLGNVSEELIKTNNAIVATHSLFCKHIEHLQEQVAEYIGRLSVNYYAKSIELYNNGKLYDTSKQILSRNPSVPQHDIDVFTTRLTGYTDWQYPGLILRPGKEDWILSLVANDPLYIADTSLELLEPALQHFPPEYQRRLRTTVITEEPNQPILNKLPGQFAVCLAYYFFNFRPIKLIEQYLIEIYSALKPGGTLIFTFNDCEHEKGVDAVERNYMTYTPGDHVFGLLDRIGYTITFTRSTGALVWVEAKKPGILTSLRGGQALAKILALPNNG